MKKIILIINLGLAVLLQSCSKDPKPTKTDNTDTPTGGDTGTIITGTDPAVAATQGFFLDNWTAKSFTAPTSVDASKPSTSGAVNVVVDLSEITTKVSKYLFGNNTNPYMGQYVTEPVLMGNIAALSPNILRAPGGSISDIYFWNADGSAVKAPSDAPDNLLDNSGNSLPASYWYGNNNQTWTITLDNYYKVLQQTNSAGLITVNYGFARYGTGTHPDQAAAHLAANWVRYDKGRTQFWDIGNENFGNWEAGYRIDVSKNKDGQPEFITGKVYGAHFKVLADSMRKAAAEVGNTNIKIGAVLTSSNDVANNAGVTNWNADVLTTAGNSPDYYIVHNYYTPYNDNSSPAVILNTPGPVTTEMTNWLKTSFSNSGVTPKPVALDEWNIQAVGSAQSVSNIAGLHAVMTLGEAIKNQIGMASRWDLANGWANGNDQGMFNIGDEIGIAKWNPRPAFYYMYFFQKHFGDRMVSSTVTNNSDVSAYASTFSSGEAGVILVNKAAGDHAVTITIKNYAAGTKYYYYTLNGGTDNAPFSHQVFVNGVGPANGKSGGPDSYATIAASSANIAGGVTVTVPKYGAVFLVAEKK